MNCHSQRDYYVQKNILVNALIQMLSAKKLQLDSPKDIIERGYAVPKSTQLHNGKTESILHSIQRI
jgi:hypothetical protein